jgi:hypothetical protein
MAKVSKSKAFAVPADQMWSRIGDFHRLQTWASGIEREERIDEGKRRRLTLGGGMQMIERLVTEGDREYTYAIDEGPLPITNYVATLRVRQAGDDACVVEWESSFEPKGIPEDQAVAIVESIYDAGLNGLDAR